MQTTEGTHAYELRAQPAHSLAQRVVTELFALIRYEIEYAMLEVDKKARIGLTAARSAAFAAIFGVAALVSLGVAAVAALSTAMESWLAALIVTAVYAVAALGLAVISRTALARIKGSPLPRPLEYLWNEANAPENPVPEAERRADAARYDLDRTISTLTQRNSGPSPIRDAILTDLAMTIGTVLNARTGRR